MPRDATEFKCSDRPFRDNRELMPNRKFKRRIFFFHGFDRRGPGYYYQWQRRIAKRSHKQGGQPVEFSARRGNTWTLTTADCETEFHFMDWTTVVRDRLRCGFPVALTSMAKLAVPAFMRGTLFRLIGKDWAIGTLSLWAFTPVLLLVLGILMSMWFGLFFLCLWFVAWMGVSWALYRYDNRFGVFYASHVAWAARRLAAEDFEPLEDFISDAAISIGETAKVDETLVVGHSLGAVLALRCINCSPDKAKLLTIGQSIPLVALQKVATRYKNQLSKMKDGTHVWIDISAGRDPLGFSGFDPSGGGARCYSAHFKRNFGASKVEALRWRGFDTHFLYFELPERLGANWNWLSVITDNQSIEARFATEKPLNGTGNRHIWKAVRSWLTVR